MLDYTHWIWLSEAIGTNTSASDALFAHFGYDATAIYNADMDEYSKALPEKQHTKIRALADKDLSESKKILDYCRANGIGVIPACAKYYYPAQLRRIKNKPVLLYYRGKLMNIEEKLNIAMVGTRNITEYGRRLAYTISYDLAKCGAVIVSGMALGIDGMSHNGALDAGGYTVAVLGCGVDRVYPSEHSQLMERILQNGIVMSEYKPFTPPKGYNFPARNRIISGLSQGCIVVEADVKSGALITANYAVEQGRRIFAVPGKAGESSSAGTNRLIQEGADMVTSARDVLMQFTDNYSNKLDLTAVSATRDRILRVPDYTSAVRRSELPSKPRNSKNKESSQAEPPESARYEAADNNSEKITANRNSDAKQEKNKQISETESVDKASDNKSGADSKGIIDIGIKEEKKDGRSSLPEYSMDEYEQQIYKRTSFTDPVSPDELMAEGIPVAKVMIGLTKLEIAGYIKTVSGGKFVRIK